MSMSVTGKSTHASVRSRAGGAGSEHQSASGVCVRVSGRICGATPVDTHGEEGMVWYGCSGAKVNREKRIREKKSGCTFSVLPVLCSYKVANRKLSLSANICRPADDD